jgi:hypothetical protein
MPDTVGQEPGKKKVGQRVKPRLFFVLALAVAVILPLLLYRVIPIAITPSRAVARPMSPWLQWIAVLTAFGVKPFYMILSLLIAIWLRRQRSPDLVALKWAMSSFFGGELFCAVNYLFFAEQSRPAEYLHMAGMAVAFGLIVLALVEFMDDRLVRFSDPGARCALLAACGKCYKNAAVSCSLRVVFAIAAPCLIALCAMPLLVEPRPAFQNVIILGTPYTYSHFQLYQLFEMRYAPAAAAIFFAAAFLLMLLRKERSFPAAKLFFSGGAGFLAFSMFRLILLSLYHSNLAWFVIWEELTELIFVGGLGLFLLVFRKKPLLLQPHP